MQISGKTMIFRKDHESRDGTWYSYSTTVSSKRQDGSYINAFMDVKFRKGVVVENKSKINVKDGFIAAREFTANGGQTVQKPELVILEFDLDEPVEEEVEEEPSGFSALTDEDMPF